MDCHAVWQALGVVAAARHEDGTSMQQDAWLRLAAAWQHGCLACLAGRTCACMLVHHCWWPPGGPAPLLEDLIDGYQLACMPLGSLTTCITSWHAATWQPAVHLQTQHCWRDNSCHWPSYGTKTVRKYMQLWYAAGLQTGHASCHACTAACRLWTLDT